MKGSYMEEIKYHPLVDLDTSGKMKMAMFVSTRKDQMEHHKLWLEEPVTGAYRLCSREKTKGKVFNDIEIYCPHCGKQLKAISPQNDGNRHAIYVCTNCR